MFQLSLLGAFHIVATDRPSPQFPTNKVRALLAYLAVEARQSHERSTLVGLLWPDMPESKALNNLSKALGLLRQALGEPPLLHADRQAIRFDPPDDFWLDVAEFQRCAGRDAEAPQLERAAELYRGEFLAGFSLPDAPEFEEWLLLWRERLHQQALAALERLAAHELNAGSFERAQRHARRQLELDSWRETAHMQLMRALALAGDRSAALAQYEACRTILREELGVEPEAETTALYEQIRDEHMVWAGANPFKGLRPFQEQDAPDFCGRDALAERLLDVLDATLLAAEAGSPRPRFLAVVGPSGSGKSSVVRAGLVPALRHGALPGSEGWPIAEMFSGDRSFAELELALQQVAPQPPANLGERLRATPEGLSAVVQDILALGAGRDRYLMLLIDQFEELFTLVSDESQRRRLLESLVHAATVAGGRCVVVVTLRADFYDRPLRYADVGELFRARTQLALPLSEDELRQVIERPAQRVGLRLEAGLTDVMIADVAGQPGVLPLLQYTLTELVERREGSRLTRAAYQELGGVSGALLQRAESLYAGLAPRDRQLARQVFLRLVSLGEGTEDTRRRVPQQELIPADGDATAIQEVVAAFTRYRMLTTDRHPRNGAPTVEVAHEALIRSWPRLRRWIGEDREGLRLHRHLTEAAQEWLELGRDPGALYRGTRLARAEEWAAAHPEALNASEREFLSTSQALAARQEIEREAQRLRELDAARRLAEAQRQRADTEHRARMRQRIFLAGLALLFLAALIAAIAAFQQSQLASVQYQVANEQRAEAEAQRTAAEHQQAIADAQRVEAEAQRTAAQTQARLAQARELAASARASLTDDPERSLLLAMRSITLTHTFEGEDALRQALVASPLRAVWRSPAEGVFGVAYSPDGKHLAVAGLDGAARILEAATRREVMVLRTAPLSQPVLGVSFDVVTLALAAQQGIPPSQGMYLSEVSANSPAAQGGLRAGDVLLAADDRPFDGNRYHLNMALAPHAPGDQVAFLIQRQGVTLTATVTLGGRPWDGTFEMYGIAYSPDGRRLVTTHRDRSVRIWDATTGRELKALRGHSDSVYMAAYRPDGNQFVTASADNSALVWDAITGQPLAHLFESNGPVFAAAYSPDGQQIATTHWGGWVRLWDAESGEMLKVVDLMGSNATGVIFAPSGKQLITAAYDKLLVWDIATGQLLADVRGHTDLIHSMAFSPDGRRLLTASADFTTRVWAVWGPSTYVLERVLYGHTGQVTSVAVSPDSRAIVTASLDGVLRFWDGSAAHGLRMFGGHNGGIDEVVFSPDGQRIAAVGSDGTVRVWDVASGREQLVLREQPPLGWLQTVAWSPDGARIVAGLADGADVSARVWDARTGARLFDLPGHAAALAHVEYSPDGQQIVTASLDGRARAWDAATGRLLRAIELGEAVTYASYSPDSQRLIVAVRNGTPSIWDVTTWKQLVTLDAPPCSADRQSAVWDPDGKRVLTSCLDGRAIIWDAATGQQVLIAAQQLGGISTAVYRSDGKLIVTAGRDRNARIWDAATGRLLSVLYGSSVALHDAKFSPDGRYVVVVGESNVARLYLTRLEDLLALAQTRVTRDLTCEERRRYLHGEAVCS
jgi:WD40 repeat protein/DNA-binding SARP family transcriptional activator